MGRSSVLRILLHIRGIAGEAPSYAYHWLFSWLYSTRVLRSKAACCPYPRVHRLLLQRSGVQIGKDVHISYGDLVLGISRSPAAVVLGDRVGIGPYVCFITSSYPNEVSALLDHPETQRIITRLGPIEVEKDAWIGAGAIIFPNVTIGEGAIVGAGAVVRHDVKPYTVVAGVPARVIRTLTSPDVVESAMESED